jgi:hypothetical protein
MKFTSERIEQPVPSCGAIGAIEETQAGRTIGRDEETADWPIEEPDRGFFIG